MRDVYFGLKGNPFSSAHDTDYFYQSSSHEQGLYYLRYGIQVGEGILVVIGALGSGKRMLIQALSPELIQLNAEIGNVDAASIVHDNALRLVADAFGVSCPQGSNDGLHNVIKEHLVAKANSGKRLLMVVENAEQLSQKLLYVLRVLTASFQTEGKSLLQVILLGQPSLQETLSAPGMEKVSQGCIPPCHLKPLSPSDMRAYMEHRLNEVGWQGQPVFTERGLDFIYCCTNGVPGLINELCERLIQHACNSDKKLVYGTTVKAVLQILKGESAAVWGDADLKAVTALKLAPLPERRKNGRREKVAQSGEVTSDASPYMWRRNESAKKTAQRDARTNEAPPRQTSSMSGILPLANFQRETNSDMPLLFDELPRVKLVEKPALISMVSVLLIAISLGVFLNRDELSFLATDNSPTVLREAQLEQPPAFTSVVADSMPNELTQEELELERPPEVESAPAGSVPAVVVKQVALDDKAEARVQKSAVTAREAPKPVASSLAAPPPAIEQKPPSTKIDVATNAEKKALAPKTKVPPPVVLAKKPIIPPDLNAAKVTPPEKKVVQAPVADKPPPKKEAAPRNDMQMLVDALLLGYNNGDIGLMLKLLSPKVEVDGVKGKYLVSQAYVKLFRSTKSRQASYDAIRWRKDGDATIGKGRYDIRIKYADGRVSETQGEVKIELQKTWDGLRISKIDHTEKQSSL